MECIEWWIFRDVGISKGGAARVSEMGVGGFTQCWGYHYSQELVPTISGNERAFMLYVFDIFPYQSISDDWYTASKVDKVKEGGFQRKSMTFVN